MDPMARLNVSKQALSAICLQYGVRELALFGSVARGEGGPTSDIDLLVQFHEGLPVTLMTLVDLQSELELLFARRVDLVPKNGLKPVLRSEVLAEAQVLYAA